MPKQKTRKSFLKRFKISKSGKMFRGNQYTRHRRSHKSKRTIRRFKRPVKLQDRQAKQIKKFINR